MLRFIKGAIHSHIVLPVILHAIFTALVVSSDLFLHFRADMPPSIVSLWSTLLLLRADTPGALPIHCGRLDAGLPQPIVLFQILGRSQQSNHYTD